MQGSYLFGQPAINSVLTKCNQYKTSIIWLFYLTFNFVCPKNSKYFLIKEEMIVEKIPKLFLT